jgi:hypothetical protein
MSVLKVVCGICYMKNSNRCTVTGCQVTWETKFCVVVSIICGLLVWNLHHVILLVPRILRWFLDFWKPLAVTCYRLEIMLLRMSSCTSNLFSAYTTMCADKLPQHNLHWHFISPVCCGWISYKGEHLGWRYCWTTSCVLRSAWVSAVCGVGWNTPKVAAQTCFTRNSWHGLHQAESYAFIRDDQRITEKYVHSLPINIGNISLWLCSLMEAGPTFLT